MPPLQLRCQPPCGAPSGFLSVACFSVGAGGFLAAAAFCTPPRTLGCSDARRSLEVDARLPSAMALWAGDGFALAIFSLMLATERVLSERGRLDVVERLLLLLLAACCFCWPNFRLQKLSRC